MFINIFRCHVWLKVYRRQYRDLMPRCRNNKLKQTVLSTESADRRFAAAVERLLQALVRAPLLPPAPAGVEDCSEAEALQRLRTTAAEGPADSAPGLA